MTFQDRCLRLCIGGITATVCMLGLACSNDNNGPDTTDARTDGGLADAEGLVDAVASVGCDPGCLVQSALSRQTANSFGDAAKTQANNNTKFALKLHAALRGDAGNLFYSPYSISTALAMTYAGARGTTATQMATALEFGFPQFELHPAFNALDYELAKREQDGGGDKGDPFILRVANSVWGAKGQRFEAPFLDTLALHYGAGVRVLDFEADPDAARLTINGWVAEKTAQRIPDLLKPGVIVPSTVMVLTNAIYFKASWSKVFESSATAPAPFSLKDGTSINVPTMRQTDNLRYKETEDLAAVSIPYAGGKVSMLVVAPKSGKFDDVEQGFDAAKFNALWASLQHQRVNVWLPKFSFDARLSLKPTLSKMGMPVAFTNAADFSGIRASGGLEITDVVHMGFVGVDEKGTEAAAATAVVIGPTSVPPPPVEVKIDRPFLFFIYDEPTQSILFVGRVLDPR